MFQASVTKLDCRMPIARVCRSSSVFAGTLTVTSNLFRQIMLFCLVPTILLFPAFLKMWVAASLWREFFGLGTAKILAIKAFTHSSCKPFLEG